MGETIGVFYGLSDSTLQRGTFCCRPATNPALSILIQQRHRGTYNLIIP